MLSCGSRRSELRRAVPAAAALTLLVGDLLLFRGGQLLGAFALALVRLLDIVLYH